MNVVGVDPSYTCTGVATVGGVSVLIKTRADQGKSQADNLLSRTDFMMDQLLAFIRDVPPPVALYIEGPMLNAMRGAGHLYEMGWWMCRAYLELRPFVEKIVEVPPSTLRKFVCGRGNATAAEVVRDVYKRWGMEFDHDAGNDRIFAYGLARFGEAVECGELAHQTTPNRTTAKRGRSRSQVFTSP